MMGLWRRWGDGGDGVMEEMGCGGDGVMVVMEEMRCWK